MRQDRHFLPMSLEAYLKARPMLKDARWVQGLEARKRDEATFHDYIRSSEAIAQCPDSQRNLKFYKITQLSKAYVRHWLYTHVNGKVFLDYACGDGRHSESILQHAEPQWLVGLDISPESVQLCAQKARALPHSERAYFFQGDCEHTEFPDNTFDVILCSEMLHHLDLSAAFRELYRISAPGWEILCCEALGINPCIQWYRRRTPDLRTEFEAHHILTPQSLRLAEQVGFSIHEVRYWHLFAIPAAFFTERPMLFRCLLACGNALDAIVLKIPYIQRLAWQFTFVLKKDAP